MAINTNPEPQSNPPDPQVPSEVASGFYDATPVEVPPPVNPDSSEPPQPPNPAAPAPESDYYASADAVGPPAELSNYYDTNAAVGPPVSASNYYDSPAAVGPPADLSDYYNSPAAVGPSISLANDDVKIARGVTLAQQQQAISAQRGQQQQSDWRVRLQLATGADYLYKASNPGILQPLVSTDGIIFPYTPKIDLSYKANYSPYELTHSNYRGYYYQNSSVGDIGLTAHFTAQSTADANYVLAVIHFFRSATKMFYGQDAQRGTPPPLVFLSGLGQYQFNNHPCLISEFTYNLPDDVDYIRAQTSNNANLNLTSVNAVKQSVATNTIFAQAQRLYNAFATKGALPTTPFGSTAVPNLAAGSPTYVPTKIDITIRLLPVNTRQQVSQTFSVKEFAKGNLLRGGFW